MAKGLQPTFRISFPSNSQKIKIDSFDPSRITFIDEWDISLNIHSRLISYNHNFDIVSGLASKFYWKGNEAHFKIRNDFKTIDGYSITAEDVVVSLKRLLILSSNTHGKLSNILCDIDKLKNLKSSCEGIQAKGDEVILKLKGKKKDLFLFKTLTASDFSIIRKESIDEKTLKIKDYRNTSGLYYFDKYNEEENIVLKINPKHWLYSKEIPQIVEIIPDIFGVKEKFEPIKEKILNGKVDALSKTGTLSVAEMKGISETLKSKNIKHELHVTEPIMLFFLQMSKRGFNLDKKLKLAIFKDIISLAKKNKNALEKESLTPAKYIFPQNGHGGLDKEQMKRFEKVVSAPIESNVKKITVEIGVLDRAKDFYKDLLKGGYFNYKIIPLTMSEILEFKKTKDVSEKVPHFLTSNQDILFEEDINLLSFSFSVSNMFNLKGDEAEAWLTKFRNEEDTRLRINMIRNLHFSSLVENTSVIPLYTKSQGSIFLNKWRQEFSLITADTPFWRVFRKD